jgi:ubiquinone/menaquinone biosynthesis C-methylase UbiE
VRLFDAAAAEYDLTRPSYPAGVYDLLDAVCGGLAGRTVADGGAGTGIVARQLLERDAEVIAFDPGEGMLRRALTRSPDLRVVIAEAAAVPMRSGSFDLVCFGQSWHWVDQAAGAREAARILKSGGWWAAWWSHPWADAEAWFDHYYSLLEKRCSGFSRVQRNIDWCSEAVAVCGSFQRPERHVVAWTRGLTISDWLTDLRSHSYVIDMGEEDRSKLLAEAASILSRRFPDNRMAVPYETRVWMAQLN